MAPHVADTVLVISDEVARDTATDVARRLRAYGVRVAVNVADDPVAQPGAPDVSVATSDARVPDRLHAYARATGFSRILRIERERATVVEVVRESEQGQQLVAYLVASELAPADIRSYLAQKLPAYMIPAAFVQQDNCLVI